MEKSLTNFSAQRLLFAVRTVFARMMNADSLWRIIIGSVVCLVCATALFAYVTYVWAVNSETTTVPTKRDPNAFLLTDLKKVIVQYQAKEERYNALLTTRPTAPAYAKGKGIDIGTSEFQAVTSVASGTPQLSPDTKAPSTIPTAVN